MEKNRNLINGQKPEFGNPAHIAWYKKQCEIMSGNINCDEIDWMPCKDHNSTTDTGKPKFHYCSSKESDALVCYIKCPKCGRLHCLFVNFDPQLNWYDELIRIDESVSEFECWNCKLEFIVEERMVYVKSIIEQDNE